MCFEIMLTYIVVYLAHAGNYALIFIESNESLTMLLIHVLTVHEIAAEYTSEIW